MNAPTRKIVYFGPTLAAARRAAAGRGGGAAFASPHAPAALSRALASLAPVVVADPPGPAAGWPAKWKEARSRFLLPPAPGILREAILGIASDQRPEGPAAEGGPNRAHWIPGTLTERRAAALLSSPPVSLLWIVEDFRRLRLSPATLRTIRGRGVRIAAFRALRTVRRTSHRR